MSRTLSRSGIAFFIVVGCAVSRAPTPPATAVRTTLVDSAGAILTSSLRSAGWEPELIDTSKRGQAAANPDEVWDESSARVAFTARRPDGGPAPLTSDEAAAVVRSVRSDVRRMVQSAGGEVLDTTDGEAYQEKWSVVTYKLDQVAGTVRVRVGPATDRPEGAANRLDVIVREQPAK